MKIFDCLLLTTVMVSSVKKVLAFDCWNRFSKGTLKLLPCEDKDQDYTRQHCFAGFYDGEIVYNCLWKEQLALILQGNKITEGQFTPSYICFNWKRHLPYLCVCNVSECNYEITVDEMRKKLWRPTTIDATIMETTVTNTTMKHKVILPNAAAGPRSMTVANYLLLSVIVCFFLGLHQLMFY